MYQCIDEVDHRDDEERRCCLPEFLRFRLPLLAGFGPDSGVFGVTVNSPENEGVQNTEESRHYDQHHSQGDVVPFSDSHG